MLDAALIPKKRKTALNFLDEMHDGWHSIPRVAALPQLDRGSDYESERHRFESCTPHQLIYKPGLLAHPGFCLCCSRDTSLAQPPLLKVIQGV